MAVRGRLRAARVAGVAVVAVVALLWLAGCGGGGASNEVDMGVAAFKQDSVTIKAGQPVHFVDPANSGGTHVICVGQGLQCVPQSGAPTELNTSGGLTFQPGDTQDIIFSAPGTYQIVCTIHPGMVLSVVVQ